MAYQRCLRWFFRVNMLLKVRPFYLLQNASIIISYKCTCELDLITSFPFLPCPHRRGRLRRGCTFAPQPPLNSTREVLKLLQAWRRVSPRGVGTGCRRFVARPQRKMHGLQSTSLHPRICKATTHRLSWAGWQSMFASQAQKLIGYRHGS